MPCERIDLPDGKGVAIICSRTPKKKCAFCGTWGATKLCDYPTPGPKTPNRTCSKAMCDRCSKRVGEDRDLCPPHVKLVEKAKVPNSVLADPEPYALSVAKDMVDGETLSVPRGTQLEDPQRIVRSAEDRPAPPVFRDHADWLEYYTERAAIGEYERGMDRTLAEYEARDLAGPAPYKGQQNLSFKSTRYVPDGENYW